MSPETKKSSPSILEKAEEELLLTFSPSKVHCIKYDIIYVSPQMAVRKSTARCIEVNEVRLNFQYVCLC